VALLLAGASGAQADELVDLRANQELLRQRLEQLAQELPDAPGGPGTAVGVGTFPRSFLIPGTDTSIRIGGQVVGSVLWYLKGALTGGALGGTGGVSENYTDGQGSTGNLPSIPLKTPMVAAGAVGYAPSRSSTWDFSGKQSRIFLDARMPSPYGEVVAFTPSAPRDRSSLCRHGRRHRAKHGAPGPAQPRPGCAHQLHFRAARLPAASVAARDRPGHPHRRIRRLVRPLATARGL
jgi:hypothetical protein